MQDGNDQASGSKAAKKGGSTAVDLSQENEEVSVSEITQISLAMQLSSGSVLPGFKSDPNDTTMGQVSLATPLVLQSLHTEDVVEL